MGKWIQARIEHVSGRSPVWRARRMLTRWRYKVTKRGPILEIYQDNADEWRWRLKAANRKIIADSGEGYSRRFNARRAAEKALLILHSGVVRIVELGE